MVASGKQGDSFLCQWLGGQCMFVSVRSLQNYFLKARNQWKLLRAVAREEATLLLIHQGEDGEEESQLSCA